MQHKRRYAILIVLIMGCILGLWAVPAKRTSITIKQPDGTRLVLALCGDEHFHCLVTTDGIPVIRQGEAYYYAKFEENGITPTELLAHGIAQRTPEEQVFVEKLPSTQHEREKRAITKRGISSRAETSEVPTEGEVNIPILLVQYDDVKFSSANPKNAFENRTNGENYTAEGGHGSIREYFIEQSDGLFCPQFDIIGPITLDSEMMYYGGNDKQGNDKHPREMISEACRKAYNDKIIDFKRYDNNNDGYVDILYVIYAGYGESSYPDMLENCIWPHQWQLETPLTLDGVKISRYACSNELNGYTGTDLDGIGTFCHEFSHCLGLPDFYNTSSSGESTFGMSVWSIMDYGCYNNDGHTPCGYTAYEKDFLGWMQLTELNTPTQVNLKPLKDGGEAYKIVNDANPNEFYVVEYYSKSSWNTYAPTDGMLVTHVDYLKSAWHDNSVNNDPNHPRVTIIPADGKLTTQTLVGDTYPGQPMNTKLTATSTPAAKVYTGEYMNKDITNIVSEDGIITFNFMQGALQAPRLHTPSDIGPTTFTITWEPVEEVEEYEVQLNFIEEDSCETTIHTTHTKEHHYTFRGLDEGIYLCRVRSISNGANSHYSESVQVELVDTILPSISTVPHIFIQNDSIHIVGPDSATIYYTIDGSRPTVYSSPYVHPFSTAKKATIRAIAHRDGFRNTSISQLTNWFTLDGATYRITSTDSLRAVVSEAKEGNNNGDYCGHYIFGETILNDTIPYTLEGIDVGAFHNAMELRSVTVEGRSIRHIGDSLFHGCTALNAVVWDIPYALPHEAFGEDSYNNLLVYLPDTMEIPKSLTRDSYATIVQNGHSEAMTLDGTVSFYCPRPFTTEKVTYRRTFKQSTEIGISGGWETIVLPFDVQLITHATKGIITPFGGNGEQHCWLATPENGVFVETTEILANIPYIISMPNNDAYGNYSLAGNVTFSAEDALIHATSPTEENAYVMTKDETSDTYIKFYLLPTYEQVEASNIPYALNIGNKYESYSPGSVFVPEKFATSPFSAYMIASENSKDTPLYRINITQSENQDNTNDDNADITESFTAIGKGQFIHLTCAEERVVNLYDAVGRLLHTIVCKIGTTKVGPLDEGLYIVEGTKVYVVR